MTESIKNNSRNKTGSSLGKIVPNEAYLDKKPIRVRKKSRALQNDNPQVSKWRGGKELNSKSDVTQNTKLKTQDSIGLPWKRKRNVWSVTEDEYTFGPPPKSTKNLKQRRSATQKNMSSRFFGEQGKLMLEALRIPETGRSAHQVTHGFHPYPGRFHPDLPKILLKQFPAGSIVFDPFMGGGLFCWRVCCGSTKCLEMISTQLQTW